MIKRSPQEIADFFGCKVQVNPYTFSANLWDANDEIKEGLGYLNHKLIHMSNTADDNLTYEPQEKQENSGNKDGSYYQDSENSENKHQSEVHIGARYVLLGEFNPYELMRKIDELLNDGFKLYGNPFVGPETSYGYIHYQAMVRGL